MAGGEPPIPDGFSAKIRWTLTYATSWMVPLVAIERFADQHYTAGWVLSALFAANLFIVSAWDRATILFARRRMTMFYLGLGLLSALGLGISIGKIMGQGGKDSVIEFGSQTTADTGRIAWNFEEAAKGLSYFLGLHRQNNEETRVSGFSAHGRNTSNDPITELKGYVRSDITNEEWPIYIGAEDPSRPTDPFARSIPTLTAETYGIPGSAEFNITTFGKSVFEGGVDGVPLSKFLRDFSSFTLVIEYDGIVYRRKFTQQEIKSQIELFERQTDPSKMNGPRVVRRPNAAPPAQPSFSFPPLPVEDKSKG
jgi:hypothetical protein